MVSGGTSRGRKRRAFRWFERKPRIPARYPFQRTMIRHCLCAIRNVERERERESESVADYWQGASLRMKSYTARGWKEKGEWDESLDGGLLSITRAPRDESLATRWPLSLSLSFSVNSSHCEIPAEIRARFGRNFGILIQLEGGREGRRWKIDGFRCCPRHVRVPGNDRLHRDTWR